jgi:hypothetical protein
VWCGKSGKHLPSNSSFNGSTYSRVPRAGVRNDSRFAASYWRFKGYGGHEKGVRWGATLQQFDPTLIVR